MAGSISSDGSKLVVAGDFTPTELPRLLAAIHRTVTTKGYRDFTIDFTECTQATAGPMVGLVANIQDYWKKGVDVTLDLPKDDMLRRLFLNANWAHLIDFQRYDESRYTGKTQVPTIKYQSGAEQHKAVQKILEILFGNITGLSRNDLRALEWSINEITDNVLNHSQSSVGGFIQVTNFPKSKRLEFAVADPGIGIPASLSPSHPELHGDAEALDCAVREGVTRDRSVGQGNGLFGTWRITQIAAGSLNISSGYARLDSSSHIGLQIKSEQIPFSGTLVVAKIPYARPIDLGEAFRFSKRQHEPLDYIDFHFDEDARGRPVFDLARETSGFGSREAGRVIRNKLLNLLNLSESNVVIDFKDVPLISSSFADEVFAMLFTSMGPMQFSRSFEFNNLDELVRALIDRAILQRAGSN